MFSLRYMRSNRGVSPIVASMMMIALVVVGGSTVALIIGNSDSTPTIDTTDSSLDSIITTYGDLNVNISLAKSAYDLTLYQLEGKKYYTSLTITLAYSGENGDPSYIYVSDFDIFVYGEKLDEIASWEIDPTSVVGATVHRDIDGRVAGYKQAKNSAATYVVKLTDTSITNARIYYDTSFTYKAEIGTDVDPVTGEFNINQIVENEEISKIVFNTIYKHVTIFHYGQKSSDTTSALNYWMDVIRDNNGSNKIYFLFDAKNDVYDTKNGDHNRIGNITDFAIKTNLVIFAEWAIHRDETSFVRQLHNLNVPLTFGGSVRKIVDRIDYTATQQVIGVIPHPFDNTWFDAKHMIITNSYYFLTTPSNLLVDIYGAGEPAYVEQYARDAAYVDTNNNDEIINLGRSDILGQFKYTLATFYNHSQGALLTLKNANETTGTSLVTSLVINHQAAALSKTAFRNMLFYAFQDPERIIISNARLDITSFTMTDRIRNYRFYRTREDPAFSITAQVSGGNIDGHSLNLTLNMDRDIKIKDDKYKASVKIGNTILSIPFKIIKTKNARVINLQIGKYYPDMVYDGEIIEVQIPNKGAINTEAVIENWWYLYSWNVAIEYKTSDGAFGAPATAATSPP